MKKIVLLVLAVLMLTACSNGNNKIEKLDDLNGKQMGCMSGSIFDQNIMEVFPDSPISYFSSRADLLMGLRSGKIDGYLADSPVAIMFSAENDDVMYIDEPIDYVDFGICFSKESETQREQFNEFLKKLEETGHLKELQDKWICPDGINASVVERKLTGENGTLTAATTPDAAPFSFFKDNKNQGYEVDLLTEFCEEYGYKLEIMGTTFDALISSVASNKYNVAFNGIYITEERKKSVDFCDPTYQGGVVAMIRKGKTANEGFFESIVTSFKGTFFEEDRWKLIVDGMLITIMITTLSMLFGTAIGFGVFFVVRKGRAPAKKIADLIGYVISGLPTVLFLMILFYIVFAKSKLSGNVIAIIGFTLIEATNIYDMLKTGTSAIDKGQYEGALALGYTDTQAFIRIILPQAIRIIFPNYKKEIVTLIKSTAIVGYVTVQDLTRVSDIIRSRTYDAFFPLFVTATIYFLLAGLLRALVDAIQKKTLRNY